MRTAHAMIGAAAMLALGTPAMAQDEAEMAEEAAEEMVEQAAEEAEAAMEEEMTEEAEPAPAYVIAAPDRFLTAYPSDGWLTPETEICLEEGERVLLAQPESGFEQLELRGALCTLIGDAGEAATIVVEVAPRASPNRPMTAAVRGTATSGVRGAAMAMGSRRQTFRVASGSPAVLEAFPRGTTITSSAEICLERGQQITLISRRGQRVTYRGPGCARRNAEPTPGNIGGFTFGWNEWGGAARPVALP